MMGTGKSTVGKWLAQQLEYDLVDLDEALVEHEGCSIASIFTNQGEAYFRQAETAILRKVLTGTKQIVATGGGVVLKDENCMLMQQGGWVVSLTAEVEDIVSRVQGDGVRPLLAGNAEERIRTILEERKNAYLFADYTVNTSLYSVEQVGSMILANYRV
ncbi:shikimate kinase [Paenibacillus crassostreae]|uniref:Shikimate kinase n=2 Tax=Paenibacillus crassostreae TaxID=1763538 RepID=A0A167C8L2_9BACL|nr:shikimate kinase [Paenibacillus crassostreae]OAB72911.1 shikimate kinase [Paenibacillus crassostreae]